MLINSKEERTCSCRHRAAPSCGQWGYSLGQELAAGELGQVEAWQELARQEADMEPLECQQLLLGLEGMQGPAPQAPSSAYFGRTRLERKAQNQYQRTFC